MLNYFLPPQIEFGDGAIQNLGEHVKAFDGKKPFLVSDAGVINAGILAKATDVLEASRFVVSLHILGYRTESDGHQCYRRCRSLTKLKRVMSSSPSEVEV